MHLIRIPIALILGLLALAEAYSAPPARQNDDVLRQKIVGIWSMKTSFAIVSATSYMQVKADGTYSSIGTSRAFGKPLRHYSEGTWSIENGVFRSTILLTNEPKSKPSWASEIAELDDQKWVFIVASGMIKGEHIERARVTAVPDDFLMIAAELRKDLKKPEPKPTSVTPPAGQGARQP